MQSINRITKIIQSYWLNRPLLTIMVIASILRLTAVIFSQGYNMHDDHFLVIEAAQSWADGDDYNNWLPWNQTNPKPEGHSFFYVGSHYLFFEVLNYLGIIDPKIKMVLVRLLHALLSLLVVFYGYKITEKISNTQTARFAGIIIAAAWFMPFYSVRNLMEMVSIPFLIIPVWIILNMSEIHKKSIIQIFFAGLILGLAFSVRFQTIIFISGLGLVVLFQKKFSQTLALGLGILISISAVQGGIDYIIWKKPFAELTEYLVYNWSHSEEYGTNVWFMYIAILTGFFISPMGLFILFGFLRTWKKHVLIFFPVLLFILVHNFISNKQERFIFTMFPFFIILGIVGWTEFVSKSKFWINHKKLLIGNYIFYWIANCFVLALFTTCYTKQARVESMVYLSRYNTTVKTILIEDSNRSSVSMLPVFYFGKWGLVQYLLPEIEAKDSIKRYEFDQSSKYVRTIFSVDYFTKANQEKPQYILFYDTKNLDKRVENIRRIFPNMTPETIIEPSLVDKIIHKMNAVNKNMPVYIYKANN